MLKQWGDVLVFFIAFLSVYPADDSPAGVLAGGEGAEEEDITSLWGKLGKVETQEENNLT